MRIEIEIEGLDAAATVRQAGTAGDLPPAPLPDVDAGSAPTAPEPGAVTGARPTGWAGPTGVLTGSDIDAGAAPVTDVGTAAAPVTDVDGGAAPVTTTDTDGEGAS